MNYQEKQQRQFVWPLITPNIVAELGTGALPPEPPHYCSTWAFEVDDDNPKQSVVIWVVGRQTPATMATSALEAGFILEVTRFRITIATNRDRPVAASGQLYYPKFCFPDGQQDNYPIHRLLAGAGAGETVNRNQIIPSDLRGAQCRKLDGPSKKDSWAIVRKHCKADAEAALGNHNGIRLDFTAEQYLANLEALFWACQDQ